MNSPARSERGYALLEVLAAGAIAAAVIMAGMGGLALSVRGLSSADTARQAMLEGRNMAARLRAGIPPQAVAEAYPDWAIDIRPFDRPVDPVTGAVLSEARLVYAGPPEIVLQFVYLEDGPGGVSQP